MLPSGERALALSDIVPLHAGAIRAVADELEVALSFRQVNPDSVFWISYGNSPVEGLETKTKTEKGGALGGLLISEGGRRESAVSLLEGHVFGERLAEFIEGGRLTRVHDENAPPSSIVMRDDKSEIYRIELDADRQKFKISRKTEAGHFRRVKFKGRNGLPLTADYDPFDFYPAAAAAAGRGLAVRNLAVRP